MSKEQKLIYDVSWKRYNDYHNTIDYAKQSGLEKGIEKGIEIGRQQGREQGIQQGKKEEQLRLAKNLLSLDVPLETIAKATGLTIDQINALNEK